MPWHSSSVPDVRFTEGEWGTVAFCLRTAAAKYQEIAGSLTEPGEESLRAQFEKQGREAIAFAEKIEGEVGC